LHHSVRFFPLFSLGPLSSQISFLLSLT
jgi:hypothetical protein